MLTLWQTALLRLSRLRLQDEIDEALRYYELSLFDVVPAINAELRRALEERWPDAGLLPPADAAARLLDRRRPRRQPLRHRRRAAPGHHPAGGDGARATTSPSCEALRSELSMSDRLVTPTPELYSPGRGLPGRLAVPRRRALPPRARRHLRAAGGHGARRARPRARPAAGARSCRRTTRPDELRADLDVVDASLRSHGPGALADDRLLRLREAVEVFGFHLCGLDLRQNAAGPRGGRRPSCWPGPGCATTTRRSTRPQRVELLAGELTMRRPLVRPDAELSETARGELDVLVAAAEQVALLGPRTIPNYVISMCESVSDVLEVAVLLKEVGLLDPGADDGPTCSGRHLAAVRDDRRPARTPPRR